MYVKFEYRAVGLKRKPNAVSADREKGKSKAANVKIKSSAGKFKPKMKKLTRTAVMKITHTQTEAGGSDDEDDTLW